MPDRAADGQFSCDTGLSKTCFRSFESGDGLRPIVCSAMGLRMPFVSSLRHASHPGAVLERAGIENESDQVP